MQPQPSCCWRETSVAASPQCWSGGWTTPNNPRRAPAEQRGQAWLWVTPGPPWPHQGTTPTGEVGKVWDSARRSGRPLQGCGRTAVQGTPSQRHGQDSPQCRSLVSQMLKVPSRGGGCPEEGAEGELSPRAGAADSLWFCPPLPLGALWERHTGAKPNPKGPQGLQGLPLRQGRHAGIGDIQGQSQAGKSPRLSPDPKAQGGSRTAHRGWGPQQHGAAPKAAHPPAMPTLPGLLSCPRCFSHTFST